MMDSEKLYGVYAKLEEVTDLQADAISDMMELLLEYMTEEEFEHTAIMDKINEAKAIRNSVGRLR